MTARRAIAAARGLGRGVLALLASMACAAAMAQAGDARALPLDRPSVAVRQPQLAAVLAMTRANARIVAVGERGVIALSDDGGARWSQAHVPVSVTLTSVAFAGPTRGWAAGHGAVILRTDDAGASWSREFDGRDLAREAAAQALSTADAGVLPVLKTLAEPIADKPILDLAFLDAQRGFAVGAYGLFLRTRDGGRTWQLASAQLRNPKALHLNVIAARGSTVLIAGEQGGVFLSADGGDSFAPVDVPYHGSFFAADIDADGRLALAGLRGNVVSSADGGRSWRAAKLATDAGLTVIGPRATGDGLLVGAESGQLFVFDPRSGSATELAAHVAPMLTSWVDVGADAVLTAGLRGVGRPLAAPDLR